MEIYDIIILNKNGFFVLGETNFEHAVSELKDGYCDAIYGPNGGILILNDRNCLVYKNTGDPIYFSVDCYLGKWKLLKNKK